MSQKLSHFPGKRIIKIFFLLLVFLPIITYSQEVRFKHLTINDGLSQNAVFAILQDSKGFMWFGTKDGLNRYDGYSFTVYQNNSFDITSISDNYITTLFEDSRGILWIGTLSGGINRFNRDAETFDRITITSSFSGNLITNEVLSLTEDSVGNIWVGTRGDGLFRLSFKKDKIIFKQFIHKPENKNSLNNNVVLALCLDSEGTLWIGTEDGINKFVPEKENFIRFKVYTQNPKAPSVPFDRSVSSIYESRNGVLWLGTLNSLVKFDRRTGTYKSYPHHYEIFRYGWGNIRNIVEDSSGKLWLSTIGELMRFDPVTNSYDYFKNDPLNPESVSYNSIHTGYVDKTGILWFGTIGMGINVYDPKSNRFSTFVSKKDPSSRVTGFSVASVLEDDNNFVWIATFVVLSRWNRKTGESISYETSYSSEDFGNTPAWSIVKSSDGKIWFATPLGLYLYDHITENTRLYKFNPADTTGLLQKDIYAVFEDNEGSIWIATVNYISKLINIERGIFKHFRYDPGPEYYEQARPVIYQDPKGIFWLGTKYGLIRFDSRTQSFKTYRNNPDKPTSLNNNLIKSLCADPFQPDKFIWIGTAGGGLNRFDIEEETFIHFTEKQGLPNNVVYGILPDSKSNLWLSTNKGLSKFDPQKGTFRNYDVRDGLQSNEFNTGAYYKSKSGEMFFGGINGLNYFFPDEIKDNPFKPGIVFTNLKIRDSYISCKDSSGILQKTISETKKIILPYDYEVVTFEFASLDYSSPGKNLYAYKLENFNNDWIYSGSVRTATFTNLDPGEYTLFVKGSNNDGVWNDTGAALEIIITPPWWRTNWAFASYGIFILMGIFAVDRMMRRKVIRKERDKAKLREAELVKKQAEELETVDRLVRVINRAENLESLFNSLLKQTMNFIPNAEKAAVFLLDKKDNLFRVAYTAGYKVQDLEKIYFTPDELKKRYTENSDEVEKGIYILKNPHNLYGDEKLSGFSKPNSMLIMAVELENITEAYVVFDSFLERNPFDSSAARLLNRFREHAVSAISKAQAIKTLQDKNEEITRTQEQLVTQQKLASLGALTAGIAHEIKNPLNFVNNFSEISSELLDEMKKELQNGNKEEAISIANDLKQNLEKINQHGKRADSIVKGMLLHSRGSSGEKTLTELNNLLDQYVTLAYHGLRAQDKEFNITIEKDYDESIDKINVVPQDISRVFLNIINNACYAANEKKRKSSDDFVPVLKVSTKNFGKQVEIRIKDNGNGIPESIRKNLFNPFFTTKPAGEGTGLGLSLSYDIVVKQHSGEIKFESEEGKYTEFNITLPKS